MPTFRAYKQQRPTRGLYDTINKYVDSVTLEELVSNGKNALNFSI